MSDKGKIEGSKGFRIGASAWEAVWEQDSRAVMIAALEQYLIHTAYDQADYRRQRAVAKRILEKLEQ